MKSLDTSWKGTFKNFTPISFNKGQDICSLSLCDMWVKEIARKGTSFPKNLKNADITSVFKKGNPLLTKGYRSVSVLPTFSKKFETTMQKQIIDYMNQYLLPCYVDTENASLHKRFCFILFKNGTSALIKKDM